MMHVLTGAMMRMVADETNDLLCRSLKHLLQAVGRRS
jgi:hypothetical protein